MAMVAASMELQLLSILSGSAFTGSDMPILANAVSTGLVAGVVGSAFQTMDTGSSVGAGVGVGVGILGVEASAIEFGILAEAPKVQIVPSIDFEILASAIGKTAANLFKTATLASVSEKIAIGVGSIVPGSIAVSGTKIASSIESLGNGFGFGFDWANVCEAIGKGIEFAFKSATGTVTITGVSPQPSVTIPAPGVPGTGIIS